MNSIFSTFLSYQLLLRGRKVPQQIFSLQSYKDQHIVIDHKITNSSGCETHLSTFEQNKIQCNTLENILCRSPHLMYISYNCYQHSNYKNRIMCFNFPCQAARTNRRAPIYQVVQVQNMKITTI